VLLCNYSVCDYEPFDSCIDELTVEYLWLLNSVEKIRIILNALVGVDKLISIELRGLLGSILSTLQQVPWGVKNLTKLSCDQYRR
jgi:hypothetical protein